VTEKRFFLTMKIMKETKEILNCLVGFMRFMSFMVEN